VLDLADRQRAVSKTTTELEQLMNDTSAFRLALSDATTQMAAAAKLLDAQDTSKPTQVAQSRAIVRLEQLASALARGPAAPAAQPQSQSQSGANNNDAPDQAPQISLAELKLLRAMQQDVNERTRQLEASPAHGDHQQLSAEQEQLAELVAEVLARDNQRDNQSEVQSQ
jgi:hypothetical protein